jgi:hypothetical protein
MTIVGVLHAPVLMCIQDVFLCRSLRMLHRLQQPHVHQDLPSRALLRMSLQPVQAWVQHGCAGVLIS